jgi:lysophospholipase L1-like esterase
VDAEDHVPIINEELKAAAKRLGCFYFDAYTVLGGKGSMGRMRDESEPRAQKDGIHLTIRGYRELGNKMFTSLMAGY